jgi:hypothetical protein
VATIARCFPACTRPSIHAHMHALSTADSLQLGAARSWCSLERRLRRSVSSMHTSNPRTCTFYSLQISLQLSAAQSWCSLSVRPCSLFQYSHRLHPRHRIAQSTVDCSAVQHAGAAWSCLAATTFRCACQPPQPRTCIALSTADRAAAQSWCSLSVSGYEMLVVSSTTSPPSAHTHAQSTADWLRAVQHSFALPGWWLRRSLFQHAHASIPHMHCFVHCRFARSRASLGAAWSVSGYDVVVSACTRLNPRTCIALSLRRFTRSSVRTALVQPGASVLTRSLFWYA